MSTPKLTALMDEFKGTVPDLPIGVYHSLPGISKTGLDAVNRCPAHYQALYLDPGRPPQREREGQLEGHLAHCAILEPEAFEQRFAVIPPDAPRRPTEAQWTAKKPGPDSVAAMKWWKIFNRDHANKQLVTAAQQATALRQAQRVRALPEVSEALARGAPEVSAFWQDPATGVPCRCRPDWVSDTGGNGVILLDVKTFATASPDEFARQVARKRYHVQAAFYSDGYELATTRRVHGFVFVVVETEWPYAACACMLDEESLDAGRVAYRRNLDTYAHCRRTGVWPGYTAGIELIRLPRWALDEAPAAPPYHHTGSEDEPAALSST